MSIKYIIYSILFFYSTVGYSQDTLMLHDGSSKIVKIIREKSFLAEYKTFEPASDIYRIKKELLKNIKYFNGINRFEKSKIKPQKIKADTTQIKLSNYKIESYDTLYFKNSKIQIVKIEKVTPMYVRFKKNEPFSDIYTIERKTIQEIKYFNGFNRFDKSKLPISTDTAANKVPMKHKKMELGLQLGALLPISNYQTSNLMYVPYNAGNILNFSFDYMPNKFAGIGFDFGLINQSLNYNKNNNETIFADFNTTTRSLNFLIGPKINIENKYIAFDIKLSAGFVNQIHSDTLAITKSNRSVTLNPNTTVTSFNNGLENFNTNLQFATSLKTSLKIKLTESILFSTSISYLYLNGQKNYYYESTTYTTTSTT